MFSACSTSSDKEVRILLIGNAGVDISTTGNTILGFRAFNTKVSASSVMKQTQYKETTRFDKKLVVVDTPGLFDTYRTEKEILVDMTKWYALVSPEIHAIILVVQVGRITEEVQETVDFLIKVFDDDLKDFLVVVFTNKDRLEDEDLSIDDFVKTIDSSSNLRKLIDQSKGRYSAIGYRGQEEDRVKEVKHILSLIGSIKGKDGQNCYSNEVFHHKIIRALKENEKKEIFQNKTLIHALIEDTQFRQAVLSETITNIVHYIYINKTGFTCAIGVIIVGCVYFYVRNWKK